MEIKTLAHILEELEDDTPKGKRKTAYNKKSNSNNDSSSFAQKKLATKFSTPHHLNGEMSYNSDSNRAADKKGAKNTDKSHNYKKTPSTKRKAKVKTFHPASPYTPDLTVSINKNPKSLSPSDIDTIKQAVSAAHKGDKVNKSSKIDNLTDQLKSTLKTDEERLAEKEALKADSRLRWLAFYYLSRREHSRGELKQKLIAKEQDPAKIDELLKEFADKGYQSDYRTAMMLIREGIRKKRGRTRIKQSFYERKLAAPSNIDELIDMAMDESDAFADFVSDNPLVDGVDWLKLAVEARVKKYGNALPDTPKDKARQLRFLQYRGFKPDICFDALKHNIDSLKNRF